MLQPSFTSIAQDVHDIHDCPIGVARTGDDLDTESSTASFNLRTQFLGPDSTDACPPLTPNLVLCVASTNSLIPTTCKQHTHPCEHQSSQDSRTVAVPHLLARHGMTRPTVLHPHLSSIALSSTCQRLRNPEAQQMPGTCRALQGYCMHSLMI